MSHDHPTVFSNVRIFEVCNKKKLEMQDVVIQYTRYATSLKHGVSVIECVTV